MSQTERYMKRWVAITLNEGRENMRFFFDVAHALVTLPFIVATPFLGCGGKVDF